MFGKRTLIGAATGAAAAGLYWAGITPSGESPIHVVPIGGGAVAGALAGMAAHDAWYRNAAVSALAGLGGATVAQYVKLRWFTA